MTITEVSPYVTVATFVVAFSSLTYGFVRDYRNRHRVMVSMRPKSSPAESRPKFAIHIFNGTKQSISVWRTGVEFDDGEKLSRDKESSSWGKYRVPPNSDWTDDDWQSDVLDGIRIPKFIKRVWVEYQGGTACTYGKVPKNWRKVPWGV